MFHVKPVKKTTISCRF